jgi:hypothetical protein
LEGLRNKRTCINVLDGSQEPPCSGEGHVIGTIHLFTMLIVDISLVNLG